MKRFIDIHSHILPGVDDGATSISDSLKMLQIAYESGTKDIILTPHFHPPKLYVDISKQRAAFNKLYDYIGDNSEYRIYDGNEVYYTKTAIGMLEDGVLATLAGSQYVLVEFALGVEYSYMENAVRSLQMKGYWSIIAHAERYQCLRSLERVDALIQRGAFIQINSSSFGKPFDFKNRRYLKKLLEAGLIHFIASDAHNLLTRTPDMSNCYEWLCTHYGEDYANQLMYENAAYILHNERL